MGAHVVCASCTQALSDRIEAGVQIPTVLHDRIDTFSAIQLANCSGGTLWVVSHCHSSNPSWFSAKELGMGAHTDLLQSSLSTLFILHFQAQSPLPTPKLKVLLKNGGLLSNTSLFLFPICNDSHILPLPVLPPPAPILRYFPVCLFLLCFPTTFKILVWTFSFFCLFLYTRSLFPYCKNNANRPHIKQTRNPSKVKWWFT